LPGFLLGCSAPPCLLHPGAGRLLPLPPPLSYAIGWTIPWSHHLVNAYEAKLVRLIQSLCAVCGSNLAGLTLLYSAALRGGCCTVLIARFDVNPNKRLLLLQLLLLLLFIGSIYRIYISGFISRATKKNASSTRKKRALDTTHLTVSSVSMLA